MRKIECDYCENGHIMYAGRTYISVDDVKKVVAASFKTWNLKDRPFKDAKDIIDILIHGGYTVEEIAASTKYSISEIKSYL